MVDRPVGCAKSPCEMPGHTHGLRAILRTRCRDIGAQKSKAGYSFSRLCLLTVQTGCLSSILSARGTFIVRFRRRSFETNAICILPDHLHAIWTLPPGDSDLASRWSQIKSGFSRGLAPARLRSRSQLRRRETGIWQRRFWEHAIRDDSDFEHHLD